MNKASKIRKSSVIQHDSADCGVACLLSVIRFYGGDSTLEKIRNLSGTGKAGTSLLGLYQASAKCGLDAEGYEASTDDIREYKNVLILHVLIEERMEHYVVCYGYEEGKFMIWDPAKGLSFMAEEQLNKIWVSKKCLGLAPNDDFVNKTRLGREKREWILSMLKPDKDLLLVSGVLGILISALGLVMALFTQKLIDKIIPSGEMRILILSSMLVLLLISTRIIISSVRQYFLMTQGKIFNVRVVDNFFTSLLQLPKSFFDSRKTGDFVARLNDTMRIQRVIADIVSGYIIDILVLIITMIVLFYYSPVAGLVSGFFVPVLFILVKNWNKRIISSQQSLMAGYALNESNFIDSLKGIMEIKSMNWQDVFKVRNKLIYTEFQDRIYNLGAIKVKLNLITGLAGSVYLISVLIWCSRQVMTGKMTQGELMAIISLGSALLPSVLNMALISIPVSEVKVAIDRMFEFTRIEPEDQAVTDYDSLPGLQKISLKDVSFRFPGQKLLIEKLNLTIEKGKVVSIVGESGCGKSTLANIILRFYQPESGRILYDEGSDINGVTIKDWRSRIAIIPQEVHVFNGTILQNLLTETSDKKIIELISSVNEFGLAEFIDSFPSGLLTLIGEEGINLSGGQKQLLAFIRILLKKPDILIIDEGTSNMDRGTEKLIMALISALKQNMGVLLISHRLNMVKNLSDHIFVMENKTISAEGTHNELIKSENLYSRFWKDFE